MQFRMMKIHREGYRIIAAGLLLMLLINLIVLWLAGFGSVLQLTVMVAGLLLSGFLISFFRSPGRQSDADEEAVISPADGKVVIMEEAVEREYLREKRLQLSIFMSPLNVHCNRYPVSGVVKEVIYHPGKYLVAWHPKSSVLNERCTVVIETGEGELVVVRQIAGTVARRIVTYAKPGQEVKRGEEMGFIKFGSRVDLFMPAGFRPMVDMRQKVYGGRTVMGEL